MQISRNMLLIGLILVFCTRSNSKDTPSEKEIQKAQEELDVANELPKSVAEESNLQKMATELNSPLDLDQPFVHDVFLSMLDFKYKRVHSSKQ